MENIILRASLIFLFLSTLFISGIIVFKSSPTVHYVYSKNQTETSQNINLL